MIEAIGKNIVVQPIFEEKKSSLLIPTHEPLPKYWKVLSIGKEVEGLSIGDLIYLAHYGQNNITIEGVDYYVISKDNVFGKHKI
jgi:co-chaperonin GroES (HSP10)